LAAKYGNPRDFNRLMGYCISNLISKGRIREKGRLMTNRSTSLKVS